MLMLQLRTQKNRFPQYHFFKVGVPLKLWEKVLYLSLRLVKPLLAISGFPKTMLTMGNLGLGRVILFYCKFSKCLGNLV